MQGGERGDGKGENKAKETVKIRSGIKPKNGKDKI